MLKEALRYEALGLSVVLAHSVGANGKCSCGNPSCRSAGKHPRGEWRKSQSARMTPAAIKRELTRNPKSNIGVATGPISGVFVIDIDGEEGLESLRKAGCPLESLPPTPSVKTGGGGIHLYYAYPDAGVVKTQAGILPKVDIRAEGGFVIAPPSVHKSGARYEWVEDRRLDDIGLAEFDVATLANGAAPPEAETKRVRVHVISPDWFEELLLGVSEGARNSSATRLAGRYLAMGLVPLEVERLLEAWNQNNKPPLPDSEIEAVIASVQRKDSKEKGLEWISSALAAPVTSIRRVTGDEPKIIMDFEKGRCTVTTADLLSPVMFQTAVAEATKVVVPKRSSKTKPSHEELAQAILRASTDEDAGRDSTWHGELLAIVHSLVAHQSAIPEVRGGEVVPISGPFRVGGRVWISLADITQRSNARWGARVQKTSHLAQSLRAMGIEPKKFSARDGTTREMWGVGDAG